MRTDITSAAEFHSQLKLAKTSVELYVVDADQVEEAVQTLASVKLQSVPGTMQIHQVMTDSGSFSHLVVSVAKAKYMRAMRRKI